MSNVIPISPIPIIGYPLNGFQYANIEPFTYSDGHTLIESLEDLKLYLKRILIPITNESFNKLAEAWNTEVNKLIETVDQYLSDQAAAVNDALAAQSETVTDQLYTQNTAINNQLTAQDLSVNTRIQNMTNYVNDAVQSIINSTIAVSDPVVFGIINNTSTSSRGFLDTRYQQVEKFVTDSQIFANEFPLTYSNEGIVDDDWTSKFQAAINNVNIDCITINKPIKISTVTIPPNRRLRIESTVPRNITGTPLITILPGGSGINLAGSGTDLVNSVFLRNLSFTSNDIDVVGAITGQEVSGVGFENLFFRNISGSAIGIKGRWYDSWVVNAVFMDCGRSGFPVVRIGDTTSAVSDSNRISFHNCRWERSKGTLLQLDKDSYGNTFVDCKFHGPTIGAARSILLGSACRDNVFIGGQAHASTSEGVSDQVVFDISGYRNLIEGMMFTRNVGADAIGVRVSGAMNQVAKNTFVSYIRPVLITGEQASVRENRMFQPANIAITGAFADFSSNQINTVVPVDGGADTLLSVGAPFCRVIGNVIKGYASTTAIHDAVITANGSSGGSCVNDNVMDISVSGRVRLGLKISGSNNIARGNIGRSFPDVASVVAQTSTDATRTVADTKLV